MNEKQHRMAVFMSELMKVNHLPLITISHGTADYGNRYVARLFAVVRGQGASPTNHHEVADTLEEIREVIPEGLVRFPREEQDLPVIVETWM